MNQKKVILGQFFTKDRIWLKPQVELFIREANCNIAYDPFAGGGHLLDAATQLLGFENTRGLDIDPKLEWEINDSLISIPHIDNAIIITNPPYISNYSAARKKVLSGLLKYFNNSIYDDLYLIALDKMLDAQNNVVAIIPETFINSSFQRKKLLHSITILEDNPFDDTDTPVCVVCFDGVYKELDEVEVYKNETFVNNLGAIERMRLYPDKSVELIFNDRNGWLGVRCVDSTDPNDMIRFDFKEAIDYDWNNGIKVSSRLFTLIQIDVEHNRREIFIAKCNRILNEIRVDTDDIILSPFKGNMKNGRRRRRLDFLTCRAIIERAYAAIVGGEMTNKDYYNYCEGNPEELLDPYYAKEMVVITPRIEEHNTLIDNNNDMIAQITAFKVLYDMGVDDSNDAMKQIILRVIQILDTTKNINFSAFAQFFMVYNLNYSIYSKLRSTDKYGFVYEMLKKYVVERHEMYLSHGYSSIVLQVLCDNYSHKRNSKTGINKVLDILSPYSLHHFDGNMHDLDHQDDIYFLPDKGDEKLFEDFLNFYHLEMKSREIEHNKLPDIVFKHNSNFYICELKTMKEGGGGQNKQVVEFAYFIKFSENDPRFHYISFLDSLYANELFSGTSSKTVEQRGSVKKALDSNPNNYFLNTKGFIKFASDVFNDAL